MLDLDVGGSEDVHEREKRLPRARIGGSETLRECDRGQALAEGSTRIGGRNNIRERDRGEEALAEGVTRGRRSLRTRLGSAIDGGQEVGGRGRGEGGARGGLGSDIDGGQEV